jgi:hypothetical protein
MQELAAPTRQYKVISLRHMFRSRSALPGALHKTFMRGSDSDGEESAL